VVFSREGDSVRISKKRKERLGGVVLREKDAAILCRDGGSAAKHLHWAGTLSQRIDSANNLLKKRLVPSHGGVLAPDHAASS